MALEETGIVNYMINTPGFEGITFTESSKEYLIWPKAVKFADDQKAVLQSLREAAYFRIQAQGKDDADRHATRTGAIYFKEGSNFYVAFDDTPDNKENIILARVMEGYEASKKGNELLISKKDKQIAQILKRAEKNNRIVQVTESPLELATKANAGSSQFGNNKVVQALFGDVAEPYARMLHKRGYSKQVVHVLTPKSLDKQVEDDKTLIRPVGLGEINDYNIIAGIRFISSGRARGVRHSAKII